MDDYEEIKRTLSKSVVTQDESLDEFEDELNALLADEKEEKSQKKKEESPSRITDEDILKRLSALRTPPEGIIYPPWKFISV